MSKNSLYPQNYSQELDLIIKQYELNSKFNKVEFDFPELQYICPLTTVVKENGDNVIFGQIPRTIKEFDIEIQ